MPIPARVVVSRAIAPILALGLVGASAGTIPAQAQRVESRLPRLDERTGIALKLLDVNVLDENGDPLPGLAAEDFTVSLDARRVEPYAVEDLCVADLAARPAVATYLYLDLSQMLADGVASARARLPELLRGLPADTGAIEVAVRRPGRRIERRSALDREEAGRLLAAALDDPGPPDATLMLAREQIAQCGLAPDPRCLNYARDHYEYNRASLVALSRFVAGLSGAPGRKRLFYLYQTTALQPERAYGQALNDALPSVGRAPSLRLAQTLDGLLAQAREIGGAAIDSETTVFPVLFSEGDRLEGDLGPISDQAVNLGATLADFTGGASNRVASAFGPVLEGAARDAACLYRIALELPDADRSRVYAVTVAVGDRLLPFRYSLEHLAPADEWMRSAQAALLSPESAAGRLFVDIVPLRRKDSRWDLRLAIDLDLDSLFPIPRGADALRSWEVGALLHEVGGGRSWEFLDVAESSAAIDDGGARILYTRDLDRMRPGVYELRAFVRDRNDDRVSAGASTAILPPRGEAAPPVTTIRTTAASAFAVELPGREKKNVAKPTKLHALRRAFVADPARLGEDVRVSRLVCDAGGAGDGEVDRASGTGPAPLLGADGSAVPAVRRETERDGDCTRIVDRYRLAPGVYRYRDADGAEREIRVR